MEGLKSQVTLLERIASIAHEEIKNPDKYTQQLFLYRKEAAKKFISTSDDEVRSHLLEVIEFTNDSIKKVLNLW